MGPAGPARGRRDGRLQPGRHRRRTHRGTGGAGRLRGLRPGGGGGRGPAARRAPPATRRAPRGPARRPGGLHRAGMGAHGRGRARLLRVRPGRGSGLRRPRGARAAAARATAAVRHGLRPGRGRGGGRGSRPRRRCVAAPPRRSRGRRAAVAGGGRHGGRLRVLVHGHATDRRGAGDALLRAHPRGGGRHRPVRRGGLLRCRTGRGQRPGGRRSRPGVGCEYRAPVSGCRRG